MARRKRGWAIRWLLAVLLRGSGFLWIRRRLARGRRQPRGVTILLFHRVYGKEDPPSALGMPADVFRRVVSFLAHRCNVISLDQALEGLRTGSLPEHAVAITFDDGYRDVFLWAHPILAVAGVPWAVFLTAGYVGTGRLLWWDLVEQSAVRWGEAAFLGWARSALAEEVARDGRRAAPAGIRPPAMPAKTEELLTTLKGLPDRVRRGFIRRLERRLGRPGAGADRVMSWEEVRQLVGAGVTVGGHSLTHAILPLTSRRMCRREVVGCRRLMEERLGIRVKYFAFPNGAGDDFSRSLVREAGYVAALDGGVGASSDDLPILARTGLGDLTGPTGRFSAALMEAEISGVLDGLSALRRWLFGWQR